MGKYERKKPKKAKNNFKTILIAVLVLLLVVTAALYVVPQALYILSGEDDGSDFTTAPEIQNAETTSPATTVPETQGSDNTEPASTAAQTTAPSAGNAGSTVGFPLLLEGGKLELESVFQYDGINPDCENQEGDRIAAINIKNLSDTYLAQAAITVTTEDGTELHFSVSDLPAGKATTAFSVDNATTKDGAAYSDVTCNAVFDADASINEDKISVSVDGMHITLQNNTDTPIREVIVYCHSSLGSQYFGGTVYPYTVNNLPANGTAELDAVDCILGLAEVVRIAISEP